MEAALFAIYALIVCGSAIAVVISQNIVRMAMFLVLSLGATAGLYFLLHADFVGATQLLIYVGGTVILLIFGVMLTASAPYASIQNSPGELLQGGFLAVAFFAVSVASVLAVDWSQLGQEVRLPQDSRMGHPAPVQGYETADAGNTSRPIGMALLGVRVDDIASEPVPEQTATPGETTGHPPVTPLSGYLLPFEIISVHLLVVLVGAAYLARAKRRPLSTERGLP